MALGKAEAQADGTAQSSDFQGLGTESTTRRLEEEESPCSWPEGGSREPGVATTVGVGSLLPQPVHTISSGKRRGAPAFQLIPTRTSGSMGPGRSLRPLKSVTKSRPWTRPHHNQLPGAFWLSPHPPVGAQEGPNRPSALQESTEPAVLPVVSLHHPRRQGSTAPPEQP